MARTYTYEARVIGQKKRFPLESAAPLQPGDDVKRDEGKYRVAYVFQKGGTYVILNPVRRPRRAKKARA